MTPIGRGAGSATRRGARVSSGQVAASDHSRTPLITHGPGAHRGPPGSLPCSHRGTHLEAIIRVRASRTGDGDLLAKGSMYTRRLTAQSSAVPRLPGADRYGEHPVPVVTSSASDWARTATRAEGPTAQSPLRPRAITLIYILPDADGAAVTALQATDGPDHPPRRQPPPRSTSLLVLSSIGVSDCPCGTGRGLAAPLHIATLGPGRGACIACTMDTETDPMSGGSWSRIPDEGGHVGPPGGRSTVRWEASVKIDVGALGAQCRDPAPLRPRQRRSGLCGASMIVSGP